MVQRIAITGLGALTPLGISVGETWEGLVQGRSGIGPITRFDPAGFSCRMAGEIRQSLSIEGLSKKWRNHLDPFVMYALVASGEALSQAGLERDDWDPARVGVVLGSSRGGMTTLESNWSGYTKRGVHGISPHLAVSSLVNQAPAMISIQYGIRGPCLAVSTACGSGAHAVGEAVRIIRSGEADIMVAGGAEAPITPLTIGGFSRMGVLSKRNRTPARACRPFDRDRDGFVVAEGAAVLILERWEHAKSRGGRILGEILGFGMTADAYHVTTPEPRGEGLMRAMVQAMKEAGISSEEIDLINAHGTGTLLNDRVEARAFRGVFGARAGGIPLCAVKSMTGHMLGASAALEAVASVLSIETGIIPPIPNLEHLDCECDLNPVRERADRREVSTVLSTSLGFGGNNIALIIRGA